MSEAFRLKDLRDLNYFFGLEIARSKSGIVINQRQYALEILEESSFLNSKLVKTPMNPRNTISFTDGDWLDDSTQYKRLIGRLLYLTITRLEITFAVHSLSQFVQTPRTVHLQVVHHVLRYVKSNSRLGLFYPSNCTTQLRAFSDADWATCPDTRRSNTSYCVFVRDALVAWKSKRQITVSRSSAKAEYRPLIAVMSEVIWLQKLAKDFYIESASAASIYCEN